MLWDAWEPASEQTAGAYAQAAGSLLQSQKIWRHEWGRPILRLA